MMTALYGSMQTNGVKFTVRTSYGKSICNSVEECLARVREFTLKSNLEMETYAPTESEEVIRVIDGDDKSIIGTITLDKIKKPATCKECGKVVSKRINGRWCPECHEKYLEEKRKKELERYEKDINRYTVIGCTTGVCRELKFHHAEMIDDEERLKTPFLLEIICGKEIKDNYINRKKQINQNI